MPMSKLFLFCFCLVSFTTGLAQKTPLSASEIKTFKEKAIARNSAITSIKSDFTQYKHLDFLTDDIVTKGQILYKAPELVKWAYTDPYQYSVIFKEGKMYIDDDGKKSNIDMSANALLEHLNTMMIQSVKGNMFSNNDFSIAYYKENKKYLLEFTPVDASLKNFLAVILIHFDAQDYEVTDLTFKEPSNDYTKVVLSNKVVNGSISDEAFIH